MAQEIYCDESGFTGNDLSNTEIPYFSFASVAVSNCEAKKFVEYLSKKYKIQKNELKFESLKKYSKGRKAISETLEQFSSRSRLVIHHKKYSLACKFFEYIFEPVLAEKNSIFYAIEFHKFISNQIYFYLKSEPQSAEDIFANFETMMRSKDINELEKIFHPSRMAKIERINSIRLFCMHHRDLILEELESLNGSSTGKWILDLTSSSLAVLLGEWGQKFQELEVFCDHSKPLQEEHDYFRAMIGNSNQLFIEFSGKKHPFIFNLKNPINFVNSKEHYGIQIADVFAGCSTFIAKKRLDQDLARSTAEIPSDWVTNICNSLSDCSVFPDVENLNPDRALTQLNSIIFDEIIDRTINKKPILEKIEHLVGEAKMLLLYYSLKMN
jgi:hypothetical protein